MYKKYGKRILDVILAVFGLIMGTVTASGIPEAIVAAILVTVIGKTLLRLMQRIKKR